MQKRERGEKNKAGLMLRSLNVRYQVNCILL